MDQAPQPKKSYRNGHRGAVVPLADGVMPMRKKKEADLAQAVIQFHKELLGRGPEDTKTWLLPDMVTMRCAKVLLPHELSLLQSPENQRILQLIKQMRRELVEQHAERLKAVVAEIVGVPVLTLYYDLSVTADECVIVLRLGAPA